MRARAWPRCCVSPGWSRWPTATRASSRAGSSSAWRSARALAIRPRVLLLDEPLSNLDAALRGDGRARHPAAAARERADHHDGDARPGRGDGDGRPAGGDEGRPRAAGRHAGGPVRAPATPFVAGFIGRSNMLPGILRDGRRLAGDGGCTWPGGGTRAPGPCTLALRPERLLLAPPGSPGRGRAASGHRRAGQLPRRRRASTWCGSGRSCAWSCATPPAARRAPARAGERRHGALGRRRRAAVRRRTALPLASRPHPITRRIATDA